VFLEFLSGSSGTHELTIGGRQLTDFDNYCDDISMHAHCCTTADVFNSRLQRDQAAEAAILGQ
jgi:hypothetical protein